MGRIEIFPKKKQKQKPDSQTQKTKLWLPKGKRDGGGIN